MTLDLSRCGIEVANDTGAVGEDDHECHARPMTATEMRRAKLQLDPQGFARLLQSHRDLFGYTP